jgi:hypothetical protein
MSESVSVMSNTEVYKAARETNALPTVTYEADSKTIMMTTAPEVVEESSLISVETKERDNAQFCYDTINSQIDYQKLFQARDDYIARMTITKG